MTLQDFNRLLLEGCGLTGTTLYNQVHASPSVPLNSLFFRPYKSPVDPLLRTLSLVSAPVGLALYTAECLLGFLIYAGTSLFNAIRCNEKAGSNLVESVLYLAVAVVSAISAVISPVVNLVDLVGGGVNSCRGVDPQLDAASLSV